MSIRVATLVFLSSVTCFAQEAVTDIPPGEDKIVSVVKEEKAPFSGQLFSPDTALRWANWLQQYKVRLKADVQKEIEVCKATTDFKDKVIEIEKVRADKVERDLVVRLQRAETARLTAEEEARNPPWHKTWTFGLVAGVVTTGTIFGLSVWALGTKN